MVGDKAAGYTAMEYHNSPEGFTELHSEFLETIGIPVQVIHIVRNPYDIISNDELYMNSGPDCALRILKKLTNLSPSSE